MSDHAPEVHAFVENYIFDVLDAVRKSQEMQDRYMPLSPQIKRASTAEIRQIAHSCADYMLSHTDEIGGLQNLGDESLIREALLRAIPTDA